MKQMVVQEDDMGCGAACVAVAMNISYQDAVTLLGIEKARTVGFRLKELKQALGTGGLIYKSSHINSAKNNAICDQGTIVFIKRSKEYPHGHFLIRMNDKWGDPWINLFEDNFIGHAYAGYRDELPGEPQWILLPI